MQAWPVQDAKARFSEFLEKCLTEGPQMVTKRGAEAAVLVPPTSGADCKRRPGPRSRNCCCRTRRESRCWFPPGGEPVDALLRASVSEMYLLDTNVVSELRSRSLMAPWFSGFRIPADFIFRR